MLKCTACPLHAVYSRHTPHCRDVHLQYVLSVSEMRWDHQEIFLHVFLNWALLRQLPSLVTHFFVRAAIRLTLHCTEQGADDFVYKSKKKWIFFMYHYSWFTMWASSYWRGHLIKTADISLDLIYIGSWCSSWLEKSFPLLLLERLIRGQTKRSVPIRRRPVKCCSDSSTESEKGAW